MDIDTITTRAPFVGLFARGPGVLATITENMRRDGFDPAFPLVIWNGDLVEGHTRLQAARDAGVRDVPVIEREFADDVEALEFALSAQSDRRNITDKRELMRAFARAILDSDFSATVAEKSNGIGRPESPVRQAMLDAAKRHGIGLRTAERALHDVWRERGELAEPAPKRSRARKADATIANGDTPPRDMAVLRWVRQQIRAGYDDTDIAELSVSDADYPGPRPLKVGGAIAECRTAIYWLEQAGVPDFDPDAWQRRVQKRGNELRRKKRKAGPDSIDLLNLSIAVNEFTLTVGTADLAGLADEVLGDPSDVLNLTDIQDLLVDASAWTNAQLDAINGKLGDLATTRKIAELRDVRGREPEEAASYLEAADRLEQRLRNRLAA